MGASSLVAVFGPEVGPAGLLKFFQSASDEVANRVILGLLQLGAPLAMGITLVVALAMASWPPRPRWRRLAVQPGWVACCASVASWPVAGVFVFGYRWATTGTEWGGWRALDFDVYAVSTFGGLAVAVAWTTLALNRRWRPEPTWPDRLGRCVGLAWMVLFAMAWYFLLWKPS